MLAFASLILCQAVVGPVRMEGPWIKETAHVTVQMASVGISVKVSVFYKDVSWIFSLATSDYDNNYIQR